MAKTLYIHIPFCRQKCFYCDFCSIPYDPALAGRYADILCRQFKSLNGSFSSIYVGGGTPTVLGLKLLRKIFGGLRLFSRGCREFSVEANPESLTADKLALFRDNGVNRISIGVQSFDDAKLKKLGRCHDSAQARAAVRLARQSGFKNISIDLIFGAPGECLREWKKDLAQACSLPVTHVSAYALSYERGTRLWETFKKTAVDPPEDDMAAAMYEYTMQYLPRKGFRQYEISNFAIKGFACRHNLSYWQGDEYVGIGAAAVSYVNGRRITNDDDVSRFIKKAAADKSVAVGRDSLPVLSRAKEAAAVKIRTREGIDFGWFRRRFGVDFMLLENEAVDGLLGKKLIAYIRRNGKIKGVRFTRKGFLFGDEASSALV
jgi:oxygen-independent coproporphyrinogen-3 oxidase